MNGAEHMGCFITFEGVEGCGKTTQIRMAGNFLKSKGIKAIVTEEPGGTALGTELRRLLLNRSAFHLGGEAELFLFLSDRAQHVREVILPALQENQWVLCDRFSDATIAYQGFGRELDRNVVQQLTDFASASLMPDQTFLFDLPVEEGLKRALRRASRIESDRAEDRFEREALEFHERVRAGYLSLSREEPRRFRIIDGRQDITAIHLEVSRHLAELINARKEG
jgi:dTMP kinase